MYKQNVEVKHSYSKSSLPFVNVNIEHNRGDWGGVGHKLYLISRRQKAYYVFNWSVLNLYVYGLKELLKVIKRLCYSHLKFIKNMTHSFQVREEWTTELGGVGQEVSG